MHKYNKLIFLVLLLSFSTVGQTVIQNRRVAGQGGGAPWFNNNYERRVEITILSSQVGTTMNNAVLMVDLADMPATFHSNVQTDLDDVRACKDDHSTELAVDPDHYDAVNDDGILWVYVGTISSSVDTTIFLYYDYPSATAYANPQDVWDATGSDYMAVYHMGDAATSAQTSSEGTTAIDADSYNMESGDLQDSKVGQGIDYDGSNETHYVPIADASTHMSPDTSWTLMCWFKADDFTDGVIVAGRNDSTSKGYGVWIWSSQLRPAVGNNTGTAWSNITEPTSGLSTGTWYHVVVTYDGTNARMYLDGSEVTDSPQSLSGAMVYASQPFFLARRESAGYYHGMIDEVRLHDSTFTANTISWVHQNQDDASTTMTIGSEETK